MKVHCTSFRTASLPLPGGYSATRVWSGFPHLAGLAVACCEMSFGRVLGVSHWRSFILTIPMTPQPGGRGKGIPTYVGLLSHGREAGERMDAVLYEGGPSVPLPPSTTKTIEPCVATIPHQFLATCDAARASKAKAPDWDPVRLTAPLTRFDGPKCPGLLS